MKLTIVGAAVQGFWYEIPKHFPFVTLDAFVVMPNHIHGIIIIDKPDTPTTYNSIDATPAQLRFRNQGKHTISSIIGTYKSICTKHIRKAFPELDFGWQELFWDNIIENQTVFDIIANYIVLNPSKWKEDMFHEKES